MTALEDTFAKTREAEHEHRVSARILQDGGEAVCVECGQWIEVEPETGVVIERRIFEAKER